MLLLAGSTAALLLLLLAGFAAALLVPLLGGVTVVLVGAACRLACRAISCTWSGYPDS